MKMGCVSEAQEILEISKEVKEKLKKMKAFLKSEYEKIFRYRDRGETYLHYAASLDHVEATKALLEKGDEVNAVDLGSWTALHFAALYGHVDVTKVLIHNGADVNAVDLYKVTALHDAARNRHVDVAKVLLQNGADVNAVEKKNRTALTYSASRNFVSVVLQLLCFGAAIDDNALEYDKTELLRPIEDRLKSLRDGKAMMKTTLMSDEERHFMSHVAWFLDQKCPEATFKAYYAIRSFITFHGIFMGVGYGGKIKEEEKWRKIIEEEKRRKIKEQEKVFMDDLSEDGFSSLEGDYEDDW